MKPTRRNKPLTVVLNGRLVGEIVMATSGAVTFRYDQAWLDWEYALPVSLSLPLQVQAHIGAPVISYLENLLPDNQKIRERVAAKVGAEGTDAYHMLEKIGRDCVGALQFFADYDGEVGPPAMDGDVLSDTQIADVIKNLATAPLGIVEEDDFRISIAGAQEKTALLRKDGKWLRPLGATPTTHIVKTQLGQLPNGVNLSHSVENEFFCMQFCRAMGANVANVEIHDFDDTRALIIERFDRRWTRQGQLIRLPQEDFCQALKYPPSQKYQADGGPDVKSCAMLLAGSNTPTDDRLAFFRAQILFWILGATDGHAKNFSLFLRPGGGFVMTPLYDILSAQQACDAGQIRHGQFRLAMSVGTNNHYRMDDAVPRHFLQSAKAAGLGVPLVAQLLDQICLQVPVAISKTLSLLPQDFPADLADILVNGIKTRHRILETGLAARADQTV
ncbi:type II toxin-antitoxin system HipA family toxin [Thalassospira mesophila]|uniref:Toxin HipA n=1 Tax=Thalassospira mesophila TaxID=1293891 RepID=A0A1Y2L2L7_9PROT|nr:type II toxin-antitoxin system HipA family toxin [Thalassospira mesophila]OSQ39585.1 toxin HipA [Thalassospira mesophila]